MQKSWVDNLMRQNNCVDREVSWKFLIEELAERISGDIQRSGDDPLDGGETERLGRLFTLELDLRQGNLTNEEYDREVSKLMFV